MERRPLGQNGPRVAPLALGTMTFGAGTDADAAARLFDMAREAGVNLLDTAGVNAGGESERIVGRHVRRDRERWTLATKPGSIGGQPGANRGGYGRGRLLRLIDASLRRLGTDYVDVYVLDWDDLDTPLEETLAALGELIRDGRVRHWGVSNYRAWRIAEMVRLADRLGIQRPVLGQPCYNAMNRMPEAEYLPACAHYGIGVVSYSPLARGVLTGKYAPDAEPPPDSRAGRRNPRMMETEFRPESLAVARRIAAHAEARGMTAGQLALNWVLNNRLVTAAIAGPRTEAQWREYLGALDHPFLPEDEALIDSLVPPGRPSTPGYADPRVPLTGREPRVGHSAQIARGA